MTGGSITRYHTPAMQGRGLKGVISEAGPITIESSLVQGTRRKIFVRGRDTL